MRELLRTLLERERYDSVVCDFLTPAPNFASLRDCVLFQHNVETMIWRRHAEHARDPLRRLFFRVQAERMEVWERRACREAGHVIAVSPQDAETMRSMFGVERISWIPTGVDVDYFRPPATAPETADLIFLGSMDWMPNTDGVGYFVEEILPLIRRRKPEVTVAVVGRKPGAEIVALGARDGKIRVTGTVADVRPWLWGAKVSIVPLRIGGGTRLKIYESMAAGVPVVSTTVGAEGLDVRHGENIRIADTAEAFASECVDLLEDEPGRRRLARAASEVVASRFSWETISRQFEQVLTAV
jgi:glycosyltransferase involved in cell wall biosynthesis